MGCLLLPTTVNTAVCRAARAAGAWTGGLGVFVLDLDDDDDGEDEDKQGGYNPR